MSEPLPDLTQELSLPQPAAGEAAVAHAFSQSTDLPFFDLDIKLIRRNANIQSAALVTAPKPETTIHSAVTAVTYAGIRKAPEFTRERQALDALEALLAERASPRPSAPVTLYPKATPEVVMPAPVAAAELKYIEPRIMPVTQQTQPTIGFVSPGYERIEVAAPVVPVVEAGEPLAALATALLQTAKDVTAEAADLLPELKLQVTRQALAARDATFAAWRPAAQPQPEATAPVDAADDLPWGHVTYRLMVM